MIINGRDISEFGGKVIDKNISPNKVNNFLNWNTVNPKLEDSRFDFKNVSITVLFKSGSEQSFLQSVSKITEMFRLGAEIKFKDIDWKYKCYIREKPDIERLNHNHMYKVIFECDSEFGYMDRSMGDSVSNNTQLRITNYGNYPTPAYINLVVKGTGSTLYVNGFNKNFTITNVKAGDIIVVSGITGEVTKNGKSCINDFWGWNLPMLPVGVTTIKTNINCDINVAYKERY